MKFGVVQFPGSNCDWDTFHALRDIMKRPTVMLWHKDHDLQGVDCVVLPGGFSYGDYLRSGAIARFSPLMQEVKAFARRGGRVLGICNGFQILLELGLLPGAMLRNKNLKFLCQHVHIRVENARTDFTRAARKGQVLRIPIAHFDGNYYAPPRVLRDLEANGQVVFRYCDADGNVTPEANVNGSLRNIAGVRNEAGNVLGLMPHPERASEPLLGSEDGRAIFESLIQSLEKRRPTARPAARKKARHDR
jgi:phosphoribosylformylglycinamidine synthase subunit PurQ / glutaminase